MDWTTVDALNTLLEEERASVEILVKLVSMATDGLERQALTAMGGQAVQACGDLHAHLEHFAAPVSGRVSPVVDRVLAYERLDDRIRAFSQIQEQLAARIEALLLTNVDPETATLLASLRAVQIAHAAWAARRAEEFAASRQIDAEPVTSARAGSLAEARPVERLEPPPMTPAEPPETFDRSADSDQAEPVSQADTGGHEERPATPRGRPRRPRWPEGTLNPQNGTTS